MPSELADLITAASCVGHLTLGVLSAREARHGALGRRLALLSLVLFGWNFAALAHGLSGILLWRMIDLTISPWTAPLALHFVVALVGQRRRWRRGLVAAYLPFAGLSLLSPVAYLAGAFDTIVESGVWTITHLVLAAIGIAVAVVVLVRHMKEDSRTIERLRAGVVLLALGIGAILGISELLADVGVPVLRLGAAATLCSTGLLYVAAFRLHLFERRGGGSNWLWGLVMALGAAFSYLAVFRALGRNDGLLVVGTTSITVLLFAGIIPILARTQELRSRRDRHAYLGRMSEQMAHDMKNPLAALKGSVQFLLEERRQGRSLDGHGAFLELMGDEIERLSRLIDRYRRVGGVEPRLEVLDLGEFCRGLCARHRGSLAERGIELVESIAAVGPTVAFDRDLLVVAIDNLIANAVDAMADGGRLEIAIESEADGVHLTIRDSGEGMDAREIERALEGFHSTKASGTGIGLPFAVRVVEAHGGRLAMVAQKGRGTAVTLALPVAAPAATSKDAGFEAHGRDGVLDGDRQPRHREGTDGH